MRDSGVPLFHPFETGVLAFPAKDRRGLFFAARADLRIPAGFPAGMTCVQGFRPDFLALQRSGSSVHPQPDGDGFDFALVLLGRHRGANEAWLGEAVARVRPGGLIVAAGGKADGAASARKRMETLVPLTGYLSKNHGVAFWFERPAQAGGLADILRASGQPVMLEEGFETAPGMFSHERVDAGSRLLADHLPRDLKGDGADFCSGWGYLSTRLAGSLPGITSIDLYEADFAALDASRKNMARLAPSMRAGFHWHDLAGEKVARKYDFIVMNPPFHQTRAAEPDIGREMIRAASGALKKDGRLAMVANRQLPYEAALATLFASHEEVARDGGFKVLVARR